MTLLTTDSFVLAPAEDRGTERRRGLRIRTSRPVKVFEPAASRYFGGETRDISTTGLRIELPAFAPIGEGETLNIHVSPGKSGALANRRQMMPARVVWVDRTDSIRTGRICAGVEFLASIAAQLDAA